MAGIVTRKVRLLLPAALFACSAAALAQLVDPTRPPGAQAGGAAEAGAGGPVLQSVLISPQGRSAIIGGETVRLNGNYGDARVVRITESEVVLRRASGTETLRMYPDVAIKPAAGAVPAAKPAVRPGAAPANTRGKQE